MAAQGVRAGKAFVELFAFNNLAPGLNKASRQLESWGRGITAVGSKIAGVGAIGMGLALAVRSGMDLAAISFAETGAELERMSERTGIAVETLSALKFAADQSGVEVEQLEVGIKKMQKALESGNPALAKLGLNAAVLKNESPEDALAKIGAKLSAIDNPTKRAALALEIFGRAGTGMLPMLKDLAGSLDDARRSGAVMSSVDTKAALELDKALRTVHAQIKALWIAIGSAFAPALLDFVQVVSRAISTAISWVKENRGLAESILKISAIVLGASIAVQALGFAFGGFGMILSLIGGAIGALVSFGSFLISIPGAIALVATAIFGLAGGFGLIKQVAGEVTRVASTGFDDIVSAIKSGDLLGAMKILWTGIKFLWAEGILALKLGWYGFWHDITGKDYSAKVIPSIEALLKAQQEYNKAIQDSRSKSAGGVVGAIIGGTVASAANRMKSAASATADLAVPLGASRGTFNSFAALSMPGGGNIPQKTLDTLKEMKQVAQKTLDAINNGGAQFA